MEYNAKELKALEDLAMAMSQVANGPSTERGGGGRCAVGRVLFQTRQPLQGRSAGADRGCLGRDNGAGGHPVTIHNGRPSYSWTGGCVANGSMVECRHEATCRVLQPKKYSRQHGGRVPSVQCNKEIRGVQLDRRCQNLPPQRTRSQSFHQKSVWYVNRRLFQRSVGKGFVPPSVAGRHGTNATRGRNV